MDPNYYGNMAEAVANQDHDLRQEVNDNDFAAAQARIDELTRSSDPADQALAATRQEALDRVAAERNNHDYVAAAFSDSDSDFDEDDNARPLEWNIFYASDVLIKYADDEITDGIGIGLHHPDYIVMFHFAGMVWLCLHLAVWYEWLDEMSTPWLAAYYGHGAPQRLKHLPWKKALEVVNAVRESPLPELIETIFESNMDDNDGDIAEVVKAWKVMTKLVLAHVCRDTRSSIKQGDVTRAIDFIDKEYSRGLFTSNTDIHITLPLLPLENGWTNLRNHDWSRKKWPSPPKSQHDVSAPFPLEALQNVRPPNLEANDFDRWVIDVSKYVDHRYLIRGGGPSPLSVLRMIGLALVPMAISVIGGVHA
jgi:hypothetical protein